MPTAALTRKKQIPGNLRNYSDLLAHVRRTLLLGQRQIESVRVRAYWKVGRDIHKHTLHHKDRAKYGEQVIQRLADDLEVGKDLVYRMLGFYEAYPIFSTSRKLSWSHYVALLGVEDKTRRLKFESLASDQNWPVEKLEQKVREAKKKQSSARHVPGTLLKPKQGKLGIYRVVQDPESGLSVDLGFAVYHFLDKTESKGLAVKDLVSFDPQGKIFKVTKAAAKDLYTYEAQVLRVVDGDTLWVRIWLQGGQRNWIKQKLRLRDVDAPELKTAKGQAAKKFLESQIKNFSRVIVTTTVWPDKWDRYLVDLFIPQPGGDTYVNNLLLENGFASTV